MVKTEDVGFEPLFTGVAGDSGASWRDRHADLFPSDESLRHFIRRHRVELIDAGALLLHRGAWQATPQMVPAVHKIAHRAAKRRSLD